MNPGGDSYTKSQLGNIRDGATPERGAYCPKCQTIVPAFDDLNSDDIDLLRDLIASGDTESAMEILQDKTECPAMWAKIWVLHPYGGSALSQTPTPPCPFCGSQLRSPAARQCPKCFRTWHDQA